MAGELYCIHRLGDIALAQGDTEGARTIFEEALELSSRIRDLYSVGWSHKRLMDIARMTATACATAMPPGRHGNRPGETTCYTYSTRQVVWINSKKSEDLGHAHLQCGSFMHPMGGPVCVNF